MSKEINRRDFFKIVAGLGITAGVGGTIASASGQKESPNLENNNDNEKMQEQAKIITEPGFYDESYLPEFNLSQVPGWESEDAPEILYKDQDKEYYFAWNPKVEFGTYEAGNGDRRSGLTVLWLDQNNELTKDRDLKSQAWIFLHDGYLVKAGHWEEGSLPEKSE
jgi:hypothetical protein